MKYIWATLRVLLGVTFLWAFIDKLFGLGFATKPEQSWLAGSSPTAGYLTHAVHGPLATFYASLVGNPLVDWLFMLGLLLIGLSLILGIGMRIACWSGMVLLSLMYLSAFPPANNPLIDEHIIYIVILFALANSDAGNTWGLGESWSKSKLVKQNPLLK